MTPARRLGFGLALASALTLAALAARGRMGRAGTRRASVVLLTIDTLRADRLGAYGGKGARTPNLDALAARGVVFEEALASVPLTLPSHSTILSGLAPPRHGVRDNGTYVFPEGRETLATVLKARGYATGAFVGAYVLDRRFGLARGFDLYDDQIERRAEGASVLESERRCDAVVDAAAGWIARQTTPFLAWVHLYDPHAPYDPPPPFREPYAGHLYDGEVAYADSCAGRLIAAAGSRGPVAIVVVGDHGEALGEHGERTHGFFVYQSTLRVPLIVAGPGIGRGERRRDPAQTVDVTPTILGLLGAPAPTGLDGTDLLSRPADRPIYAETLYPRSMGWAPLHSLRAGPLKYIEAPRPELYDLDADPGESRDLAAARPGDASRLREALATFRGEDRPVAAASVAPEVAERLRALGYAAGASEGAPAQTLKDPKDAVGLWRDFEESIWAEARGDRDTAITGLRDLVRREPANTTFRRSLASGLRRAGKDAEAAALLDANALADDPLAWHERAVVLGAASRVEDAIRAEDRAIALNPLLPEPYNHRGVLEARRGHMEAALGDFEKAVALDPNNARAWNNRANALRTLGRREEAASSYKNAARLAPGDPDPLNGWGVLAAETGDLPAAASAFQRVLEIDPSYSEAAVNLAFVEARQGRTADARSRLQRLLARQVSPETARKAQALLRDLAAGP
jgi:arylsulfatase A-like enzyme/thioredoxin-like negative regulator of GroEL